MFVRRLYELGMTLQKQGKLAPSGYTKNRVRHVIELDKNGGFEGYSELYGEVGQEKEGRQLDIPALAKNRSGKSPMAVLLVDNAQFVLGHNPDKPKLAERCNEAFITLATKAANELDHSGLKAVCRFYEDFSLDSFELPDGIEKGLITFEVDGEYPFDDPAVRTWWLEYLALESERVEGVCGISGEQSFIVKRHPQGLKRLWGLKPAPFITANESAYWSYGKEAAYNCPVSFESAELFGKALNYLLRDDYSHHVVRVHNKQDDVDPKKKYRRRISIGREVITYVFWTKNDMAVEDTEHVFKPDESFVKELLRSPIKGKPELSREEADALDEPYYAASIKANIARVQVRDWIETTVGGLKANLRRWFRLMSLYDWDGSEGRYYGIEELSRSLVLRKKSRAETDKQIVANVPRALIACALNGTRLPDWLLFQAIKRNRAEQGLTRPRAILIKMILHNHYGNPEEDYMTELVMTKPAEWDQPAYDAYLCGRLLAVLDGIQGQAIPGAKATMLDRYYGTASSAPATVFGTLLRGAQNHLAKFRKEKKGLYIHYSKQMEEIIGGLGRGFPTTLNLKQQAMFSLGFYHQRAWRKPATEKADKEDN